MTPTEINAHAHRIASQYCDEGVEYSYVHEDEQLAGEDEDTQRAIHDRTNAILRGEA